MKQPNEKSKRSAIVDSALSQMSRTIAGIKIAGIELSAVQEHIDDISSEAVLSLLRAQTRLTEALNEVGQALVSVIKDE